MLLARQRGLAAGKRFGKIVFTLEGGGSP